MIISKSNEKIKLLKQLQKDKNFAFLDNPKLIKEAQNAGFEILYILINSEKLNDKFNDIQCLDRIEVNDAVFKLFSNTCNSQGVIGIIKNFEQKLDMPKGNFLILDSLQDPGNIGTLLRTACGANFKDVYLVNCVNMMNDKLIRSSMGAIFKLNIYECTKTEFLDFRNNILKNIEIYVGDLQGENVFDVAPNKQFGIILGNEGNGVCDEMKKIVTKSVSIPMKNNLESLNVAVAGAILMYELNKNNIKN